MQANKFYYSYRPQSIALHYIAHPLATTRCLMKAIISVFISAYLPSMASFECRADSVCGNTNQTPCHHTFNHDELAWAILRAKKQYPIGYCITYLHYVSYQFEYAKAVRVALNEQLCRLEQAKDNALFIFKINRQNEEISFKKISFLTSPKDQERTRFGAARPILIESNSSACPCVFSKFSRSFKVNPPLDN